MKYECDCGARYSNLDAMMACQNANHGVRTFALEVENAKLKLALERAYGHILYGSAGPESRESLLSTIRAALGKPESP